MDAQLIQDGKEDKEEVRWMQLIQDGKEDKEEVRQMHS